MFIWRVWLTFHRLEFSARQCIHNTPPHRISKWQWPIVCMSACVVSMDTECVEHCVCAHCLLFHVRPALQFEPKQSHPRLIPLPPAALRLGYRIEHTFTRQRCVNIAVHQHTCAAQPPASTPLGPGLVADLPAANVCSYKHSATGRTWPDSRTGNDSKRQPAKSVQIYV